MTIDMSIKDGGPAFPFTQDGFIFKKGNQGISIRDYFAAKAMLGILQARVDGLHPEDLKNVAEDAYLIADSMLKAREKSEGKS